MQFTQAIALVALLFTPAFGRTVHADPGKKPGDNAGKKPGDNAGSNTGHNSCGPSTFVPITGNGPYVNKWDCETLKNDIIAKQNKNFLIRHDRAIGHYRTCELTATVDPGAEAWFGVDDAKDLIQSSLDKWEYGTGRGTKGTTKVGADGGVPCNNAKKGPQVTVYWTLGYNHNF